MNQPYYKKDGFSLHLGDSLSLLNDLPENSVDMIFAGPPYFLSSGSFSCHSGTYHSIYQCGYALELNKYHFLNDIAWLKPNAPPNLSCRFFTASHETIIWARAGSMKS